MLKIIQSVTRLPARFNFAHAFPQACQNQNIRVRVDKNQPTQFTQTFDQKPIYQSFKKSYQNELKVKLKLSSPILQQNFISNQEISIQHPLNQSMFFQFSQERIEFDSHKLTLINNIIKNKNPIQQSIPDDERPA